MVGMRRSVWLVVASLVVLLVCATGGCGAKQQSGFTDTPGASGSSGDGTGGSGDNGGGSIGDPNNGNGGCITCGDSGPVSAACAGGGLSCYVKQGCTTTLSGIVRDPAGRNPLFNVLVYVPNDPMGRLPTITPGTNSCNTCDAPVANYVAITTSDATGHFTLHGVPATTHVPIVVQTGKWRRLTFLNSVTACQDNPVPADNSRLPRSKAEGDLPQMLLMTGGCDDLGCFLKNIGIDSGEFTAPTANGRLHVYQGSPRLNIGAINLGGAAVLSNGGTPQWGNPTFTKANFERYDIAILSCECAEHQEQNAGKQALHDWLNEGGKVFASHYNYTWFQTNPQQDFQNVATWLGSTAATGNGDYDLDVSFQKGQVLRDWLANIKQLSGNGPPPTINLKSVADSVSTVNMTPPQATVRWIYDPMHNNDTKYLSFTTPIGGAPGSDAGENGTPKYCGKAVFTDLHTSSSLTSQVGQIPSGCKDASLTPQQAALEFLFFDLSACVSPDNKPVPPPPPSIQ